jgi:hypothetical protein
VRRILHETFERAGEVRHTPTKAAHFVGLLSHMVARRRAWHLSYESLSRATEHDEALVLREVQLAVLRQPALLNAARGRTGLIANWNDLLLNATAKVERDRRDGERLVPDPDDAAIANASVALAAQRWQD